MLGDCSYQLSYDDKDGVILEGKEGQHHGNELQNFDVVSINVFRRMSPASYCQVQKFTPQAKLESSPPLH